MLTTRLRWDHLCHIGSIDDLKTPRVFYAPSGRPYQIRLDTLAVERTIENCGRRWGDWAASAADIIGKIREQGENVVEEDLRRHTLANLMLDMGFADAKRLDLIIHVLARRAIEAARPNEGYNPKGKPNDPMDLDLLFGVPLPGWICTQDLRLHQLVRSTASKDREAVMIPNELYATLDHRLTGAPSPKALATT